MDTLRAVRRTPGGWEDTEVTSTADVTVTTTREQFRALAAEHRFVPVTRKVLADSETPLSTYRKLAANRPGTFLLESAENGRSWSRWSFIGAGAPSALTVHNGESAWIGVTPQDAPRGGDPLAALRATMDLLATEPLPGLPPLSGGLVGFFAYDMVRRLERLPSLATDDLELPDMHHHMGREHGQEMADGGRPTSHLFRCGAIHVCG